MKKLMTMIGAAAAAFGLYAAETVPSPEVVGFEDGDAGVTLNAELDYEKAESEGEYQVWWKTGDAAGQTTVKAHEGTVPGVLGDQYLYIESDGGPITRTFAADNEGAVDFGTAFVSTYVQFTAADSTPANIGETDKIALWLQEDEDAGTTNLMVSCGIIDEIGGVEITNIALVADGIEPNSWHKVTIKPVLDSDDLGPIAAGFLVYLDAATTPLKVADDTKLVDDVYAAYFTATVKPFVDAGQFLPSRVAWDSDQGVSDKLVGIGFDGTGAIDNFAVLDEDPFPPTFAIKKADTEGGSFTVTVNDEEVTEALANVEVKVTAEPDTGYVLEEITVVDADGTPVVVEDGVFTMPASDVTVTVTFTAESKDWPEPDDPTIKDKNAKEAFGDKVPNDLANVPASKFAAWAKKAGIDFENPEGITKDAYLLDCAPDKVNEEKAKFKIVSIEFIDDEWVVKVTGDIGEGANYTENAKVVINDITETLDSEAKVATDAKGFFRATLDFND